ncbi:protein FMP32, mitochondrial isoform X2 [Cryptomeria japonica]|uniref:protein FMP32, mitochondrial isoform X2 n=1 Tax=Cryptomeria japonica TaxID=3369 RepID=UPI0025ACBF85|nr:protein FMP32, mitochondrial isoform X2 [Cryptomeria japonica]
MHPRILAVQICRLRFRRMSDLVPGNRACLVDTMALVKRLEGEGMTQKQAEAITAVVTEVLQDSLDTIAHSFVSREEMIKSEMLHEAALSKYKGEVKSSQDHNFSLLQRETERLRTDIEKLRSELKYEVDKVTAGQRLDLNLEKGHIREELSKQNSETADLTNKLNRLLMNRRFML